MEIEYVPRETLDAISMLEGLHDFMARASIFSDEAAEIAIRRICHQAAMTSNREEIRFYHKAIDFIRAVKSE